MHFHDLETPAVLVVEDVLKQNLARYQQVADTQSCKLRPHIKTHRTVELARLQRGQGARGVCCAKLNEAEALADAGFDDIVVAYPLVGPDKAARFNKLTRRGVRLACVVDTAEGAASLTAGTKTVEAYIKVDTGFGRIGIDPVDADAADRALRLFDVKGLQVRGLLTHAGYAYAGDLPARNCMEQERDRIVAFHRALTDAGLNLAEVSVGSTATVGCFVNTDDCAVTELRPGNYVFNDATQVRLGVAQYQQCSQNILASVVSVRDGGKRAVLDSGSKIISSDRGGHGAGPDGVPSFGLLLGEDLSQEPVPDAKIWRLSEEHGWLLPGQRKLKVGDKVRILPNHACAVSHLSGALHLVDNNGQVVEKWPVMARGNR